MTKFNKGDVVRVIEAAGNNYNELAGLVAVVLSVSAYRNITAIDVTALNRVTEGKYGWPNGDGKMGWYINNTALELVAPAKVEAPVKVSKITRPKRTTQVAKSALSPQCKALLGLLEAKGSVTALEASGVYRIRSLSRRITDLKVAGYTIVRDLGYDTTGQRYARYYLKGQRSDTVPQDVAA